MWIFLGIVGGLALLITVILLLPVSVIIKNDENNNFLLHYKFLGKLYGEVPDPASPIVLQLKKTSGLSRIEKQFSNGKKTGDLSQAVCEICEVLGNLLKELVDILKHCTAKKFSVRVVCATDNAADTAISYGLTATAVHGLYAVASNLMKVRKRGKDIYIGCDFSGRQEKEFRYHFVVVVRLHRALVALWRLALKEVRRDAKHPAVSSEETPKSL